MTETDLERARREAGEAIEYAHLLVDLVSLLLVDMQRANILRPATKTKVLDALRDRHLARKQSGFALERLERTLRNVETLEREEKRERPDG